MDDFLEQRGATKKWESALSVIGGVKEVSEN